MRADVGRWLRLRLLQRRRGSDSHGSDGGLLGNDAAARGSASTIAGELGRVRQIEIVRCLHQLRVGVLIVVRARLRGLLVFHGVRCALEDLGAVSALLEPRDEDGAQGLGRDGCARHLLEETANVLRPRGRLHRTVWLRSRRRVEDVRLVELGSRHLQRVGVGVEHGCEGIWQLGSKGAVEFGLHTAQPILRREVEWHSLSLFAAHCLVPIALLGQVEAPSTAPSALQRVAEAQLADQSHTVGWNQREQRERSSIPQRLDVRPAGLRPLHRLQPRLLHVLPTEPATDALLKRRRPTRCSRSSTAPRPGHGGCRFAPKATAPWRRCPRELSTWRTPTESRLPSR
eukprot:1691508-Prymnesium_polylepis.1